VAVVLVILAAVVVFAIAAVVVGREARRLDAVAPRAVYELEEAVAYVAEGLRDDDAGQLTHDELRGLLMAHVRQLWQQGLVPEDVTDRTQDPSTHVVLHEDAAVAFVLGEAGEEAAALPDEVVVRVVDLHFAYLRAIGAVGPPVPPDEA
jgi:hypothetical protein